LRQIKQHWHQLTLPHATDDDQAHREYLTKVILIFMGGTLSIFTLIIFTGFILGQFILLAPAIMLAIDLPVLVGWWLAQRGHWQVASFIPPIITFAVAVHLNSVAGFNTTGYLYYVLAILLTAMLVGIKAQWFMVGMTMVSSVFFGVTHWGLTPMEFLSDLILIGAAAIGAGLLQWLSTNQLKRWLTQSRQYAAELSERTADLSKANLALRQTSERLEIMHQIDQAVLAAQSPEEIAQAVVNHIRRLSACQRASIALFDLKTERVKILAVDHDGASELGYGKQFPLYEFGGIQEMSRGQHRLIYNLQTFKDPGTIEEKLKREGIKSILNIPLLVHGNLIGSLNLGAVEPDAFQQEHLHIAYELAGSLAVALQNAQLFQETQQRFNHLLALRMIDRAITSSPELSLILDILLDQVLTQLDVNAASVLLHSEHTHTLDFAANRGFHTKALQGTHLSIGEGHAGRAALEQRIIQIDNLGEFYGEFQRSKLLNQEGFHTYFAVPLIAKGQVKGVLEIFHRLTLHPDQDWLDLLDSLATQTALAIDNARLFESLQSANIDLIKAYDATIEGWSRALDLRDEETEGHSQRVTRMTLRLAREMGVRPEEIVNIQRGALLHDIGKMGVPDRILLKPAPLTDEEWQIMRQHPVFAYKLLSPIDYLRTALDIPYCHHEKWDGSGYPRGLKGEQIPLAARIFAVVDVWDALSSVRPYRKAWEKTKILDYITSQSGIHFDPRVVDAFLGLLERAAIPDASILLASD
jgi:HD-GYP domain-containing protein (c-di-GMP phosphodiesterase class II)